MWTVITIGPRKEEYNILQAALDAHAHTPGAATSAKLTVSKELLSTVANLSFWSGNFVLLSKGMHPFHTIYISITEQAQDQAALQTYDSLAQDGTLHIQLFQLVLKSNCPTDFL